MLNIIVGSTWRNIKNEIVYPSSYFDANYEQSWFQSDLARAIVKGIDGTVYVSGEYFESPVLGGIPPRDLSTGCKATLLLLNDSVIIRGERFGDNCAEWILKIAESKDIVITLNHYIKFPEPFKIKCLNTRKILTTRVELLDELIDIWLGKGVDYVTGDSQIKEI